MDADFGNECDKKSASILQIRVPLKEEKWDRR